MQGGVGLGWFIRDHAWWDMAKEIGGKLSSSGAQRGRRPAGHPEIYGWSKGRGEWKHRVSRITAVGSIRSGLSKPSQAIPTQPQGDDATVG